MVKRKVIIMDNTYFENEKYKLYLGDVLEVLKKMPSESVDMIFTSPPYNLDLSKSSGDFKLKYDNYDDNMSWEDYVEWQINVLCFVRYLL